ncbi:hypothetical protein [Secundilactobacillus silagei]|uniref:Uncharacterized protein n=1 Tax=Secundilactobacillus silagei JCM 19001 TaxID=1302250 RepID=A0A1Z5H4F7_9LACO|nr:hypothetical protein [Secundilactobacillus silagei]TDG70303.1 hypothetical protein C5L25_001493 [Secundilactobacillus silagei JCM 19001]GAT17925.1 hypothetical protein IWT126_00182 [Secundilactobacillus silagei JCM 19001]
MKKLVLVTLSLIVGLVGGLSAVGNTASASSLQRGLPRALRNSKWQSKSRYIKGLHEYRSATLVFHKMSIVHYGPQKGEPVDIYGLSYKYAGHHIYELHGHLEKQAVALGLHWAGEVKIYSSHKINYADCNITEDGQIFTNNLANTVYNRK